MSALRISRPPRRTPPSRNLEAVFAYTKEYYAASGGEFPTNQEIALALKVSVSLATRLVRTLFARGAIRPHYTFADTL